MTAPNVRAWVQERIIVMAMMIFLVGAGGYIGAGKIFSTEGIWLHPFQEFALLIAMIGVVSFGYEIFLRELTFNEYKSALREIVNPDAVRLGITNIFKNRSELGRNISFDKLFKNVKKEIFIGGSSLLSIATNSRDLLKEKVLSGTTVKLLLMDPGSPVVEMISRQAGAKATFKDEIRTSLLLLHKLKEEIEHDSDSSRSGELIVHTYNMIPSHSFIAIDSGEPSGMIVADIGPYLGRNLPRPSMVVSKKKNGMYDYWQEMNELLWKESKLYQYHKPAFSGPETKTLVLASGIETEHYSSEKDLWKPASICQMNGTWRSLKGSQWVWIRDSVTVEEAQTGSQNRFRAKFALPDNGHTHILRAELFVRCDDYCRVEVNDYGLLQKYGGATYPDPFIIDIGNRVKPGENIIEFEVNNFAKPSATTPEDNPTGLIYRLHVEYRD